MAGLFDLGGRVAVVTGGNGGIGLGMAEALAAQGCTVSIWGRDEGKNARALEALRAAAPWTEAESRVCDVADREAVAAAFSGVLTRFGRVDGVFANAGVSAGARRSFMERGPEEWRRLFATNLDGVVAVFQLAARHMAERAAKGEPFGRLVATSSTASIEGAAFNEHYGATKGALNAMVRAIAVELARHGVTANAILPGWIETEMTARLTGDEKFVRNVLPRIPVRRFGKPEDFGALAVYLMSAGAGYTTGQVFTVDGGYTIY